jgi:4-carboxymuconolactone decarboxylase
MSPRVPSLLPADLTPEQTAVYRSIVGGPRAQGPRLFDLTDERGRLNGPFGAMLIAPEVGGALQALGAAVRYGTSLNDRVRELAILAVATHWDSAFERYAHEAVGRAAGLAEQEIAALRDSSSQPFDEPRELASLNVVRALLEGADLDDLTYSDVASQLSAQELVELTTLVGYYSTLALLMRVLRTDLVD